MSNDQIELSVYQKYGNMITEKAVKDERLEFHQIQALLLITQHFATWPDIFESQASSCICIIPKNMGKTSMALILPYVLECNRVLFITCNAKQRKKTLKSIKDSDGVLKKIGVAESDISRVCGNVQEVSKEDQWLSSNTDPISMTIVNASILKSSTLNKMDKNGQSYYDLIIADDADLYHPIHAQLIHQHFGKYPECNILFLISQKSWMGQPKTLNEYHIAMEIHEHGA